MRERACVCVRSAPPLPSPLPQSLTPAPPPLSSLSLSPILPAFIKEKWWSHVDAALLQTFPLVSCRPIAPMLQLFGINHVDFWVLDVEGAELEVVHTMDFSAITVDVIVAELDGANQAKDDEVRAHLVKSGFEIHSHWVRNDWWTRVGFEPCSKQKYKDGLC